jgi:hypothetical protein
MAYVYRHIRLDKNEPFYIGIGSDGDYKRSRIKSSRSKYWKNIVNNCEYKIDILFDDLTWEEACEKEKEFIALYGRKDLGSGTLVNLTSGGDGNTGMVISEERKKQMSYKRTGRKMSFEERVEFNKSYLKRSLTENDIQKIKERMRKEAVRASGGKNIVHTESHRLKMSKMFSGDKNPFYGKKHSSITKEKISKKRKNKMTGANNHSSKLVLNTVTGIIYDSASDAAFSINMNKYRLRKYLGGFRKNKTDFKYIQ